MVTEDKTVLFFTWEKDTTGTHRYKEVDDAGNPKPAHSTIIGSLYVRKTAMPKRLTNIRMELSGS